MTCRPQSSKVGRTTSHGATTRFPLPPVKLARPQVCMDNGLTQGLLKVQQPLVARS